MSVPELAVVDSEPLSFRAGVRWKRSSCQLYFISHRVTACPYHPPSLNRLCPMAHASGITGTESVVEKLSGYTHAN